MIDLIFCNGGNPRLMDMAIEEGWLPGARSDMWAGVPLSFVDVDYKHPDWQKHLARVEKERPKYATVPDLSEKEVSGADIARALAQVEKIAPYCDVPLIVPKLSGQLDHIPDSIAIGYSVPSRYGGASYFIQELEGRRVHLLGGSPKKQQEVACYLEGIAEVISADGNYATKMAQRYMEFWNGKRWQHWPAYGDDEFYACCRASLRAIRAMWQDDLTPWLFLL